MIVEDYEFRGFFFVCAAANSSEKNEFKTLKKRRHTDVFMYTVSHWPIYAVSF